MIILVPEHSFPWLFASFGGPQNILVIFMTRRGNWSVIGGVVMFSPCLFCPSDNDWCSLRADAPWCAHFSIDFTPSWITEQISVEKCAQTMFKIVTWTKKTWTKHHNTEIFGLQHFSATPRQRGFYGLLVLFRFYFGRLNKCFRQHFD